MSSEPSPGPGERGEGAPPPGPDDWGQDVHGADDWGQEAVLDELMAAFGSGPEPVPPADSSDADSFDPLPEFDPVPEFADAGFLPRGLAGGPVTARLARGGRGAGFASGEELDTALPGPALAGFADAAAGGDRSYAGLDDDELIGTLVAWQKTEAWAASGRLSAVAELIRRRPGDGGSAGGTSRGGRASSGGVPPVWEKFCPDELAVALASSQWAAERMLGVAYDLAFRLPRTARALNKGLIDSYRAQIIAEATRVLDDAGAAAAESLVLPAISGKTPGQVRAMIGRAVLKIDPDAARQRREQAQRDARVELWREDAGTAALCGFGLPPDEALAADQTISDRALQLKSAGMAGTMDQLRVRAYLDALLGQDSSPVLAGQDSSPQRSTGAQGPADDPADKPDNLANEPDNRADQPHSPRAAATGAGATRPPDSNHQTGGDGDQAGRGTDNQAGLAARINLTVPLATLLGLAERPGEAAGFGPIDADLARAMATAAATHPATSWCITVTDAHGHPTAHGCARPARRTRPEHRPGRDTGPAGPATGSPPPGTGPPSRSGGSGGPHTPGTGPPRGYDIKPAGTTRTRPPSGSDTKPAGTTGTGPPSGSDTGLPSGPSGPDTGLPSGPSGPDARPGGYGTWRLRPGPHGPDLTVAIEPIAVTDCDHRHETAAHDPGDKLRHLVNIRDGECTWPPCRRAARRCDFEHAIPWEAGGRTCACNAGPRCRHHHHQKQAPGWRLDQHQPGYHTWTTPSGRQYTTGPTSYPI